MPETTTKRVLIVDDEESMGEIERDGFLQSNERGDCPYHFEIDLAASTAECIERLRADTYDVIILDVRMEQETSGIQAAFALREQLGGEIPVRIISTGYPSYPQCIEAIRSGVWDYLVKSDASGIGIARRIVDSAVCRLRQIDLREKLEQEIGATWLPSNFHRLQETYGGQLVALWHEPEVGVIAHGRDAFELEETLGAWRGAHPSWYQPYVLEVPTLAPDQRF